MSQCRTFTTKSHYSLYSPEFLTSDVFHIFVSSHCFDASSSSLAVAWWEIQVLICLVETRDQKEETSQHPHYLHLHWGNTQHTPVVPITSCWTGHMTGGCMWIWPNDFVSLARSPCPTSHGALSFGCPPAFIVELSVPWEDSIGE